MRVVGPRGDSVLAVGVVVRCFSKIDPTNEGASPGMAIAITSTSEAWDRFWDDVSATEEDDDIDLDEIDLDADDGLDADDVDLDAGDADGEAKRAWPGPKRRRR
jgi:hypothetical protein